MAIGIQELSCEISWIRMEIRYDSFDSLNLTKYNHCQGLSHITKYSHLFNKRGGWNKRGGGAKVAKSLNVDLGINEEGGIFGKN